MSKGLQTQWINLQEGFLVTEHLQPLVAFSNHKKILVWKEGFNRNNTEIPENFKDFQDTVIAGHFNVSFFDLASYNNLGMTDVETEGKPYLIAQAKNWLKEMGNPSDSYLQSRMWEFRDPNTSMRQIVLAIRDARKELKIPEAEEV